MYTATLHSATGKIVVLEDINGNISLLNSRYDLRNYYAYKNMSSITQLSHMLMGTNTTYHVQYKVTSHNATTSNMYISKSARGIEIFGSGTVSLNSSNNQTYFSNIPLPNSWVLFEPNKNIQVGANYTVNWHPSYPGKYKSIGVISNYKRKEYVVSDIVIENNTIFNGNFTIRSNTKGVLQSIVIYYHE
jgi:hypothetical protein